MTKRKSAPAAPRSAKAGCPPEAWITSSRTKRGPKRAHVAVRKDTMMSGTDHGPRVLWGVTKPKIKKR